MREGWALPRGKCDKGTGKGFYCHVRNCPVSRLLGQVRYGGAVKGGEACKISAGHAQTHNKEFAAVCVFMLMEKRESALPEPEGDKTVRQYSNGKLSRRTDRFRRVSHLALILSTLSTALLVTGTAWAQSSCESYRSAAEQNRRLAAQGAQRSYYELAAAQLEAAYRNCLSSQRGSGYSGSGVPSYSAPAGRNVGPIIDALGGFLGAALSASSEREERMRQAEEARAERERQLEEEREEEFERREAAARRERERIRSQPLTPESYANEFLQAARRYGANSVDSGNSAESLADSLRDAANMFDRNTDPLWDLLSDRGAAQPPTGSSGENQQGIIGTWSGTLYYTSGRAGYSLEGAQDPFTFFINSQTGRQFSGRDAMNAPLSGSYDQATRRIGFKIESAGSASTVLSGVLSPDGHQINGSGTSTEPGLTTRFTFTVNR